MKFVSREDWGAPASSPAAHIASTRGVKIHYLGTAYSSRAHSRCDDYVRDVRRSHLANTAEGYVDIAYNLAVCEHGYVYEGRGAHKKTGANGNSSLNSQHYAVLALLGSSGLTKPTDAQLHGLRDGIEYLREHGKAGSQILGHRDGYATACPGGPLYAWVQDGAPRPGGSSPKPPAPGGGTYTVRKGDTLTEIAREHGTTVKALADLNKLADPDKIRAGRKLKLPGKTAPGPKAPPFPGRDAFRIGRTHPAVTQLDKQLIRLGYDRHHDGNGYQAGPRFTTYTRDNVAAFQRSRQELAGDADGYPGPLTWRLLHT